MCLGQGLLVCRRIHFSSLFVRRFVSVRAQPRGWTGSGEGLVGRLCRMMGHIEKGGDAMCIGVCASAAALLRMMLATGK